MVARNFPRLKQPPTWGIQKSSKKDYSPVSTQQNLLYSDGYQRIGGGEVDGEEGWLWDFFRYKTGSATAGSLNLKLDEIQTYPAIYFFFNIIKCI
jgi:hypothetical protein